MTVYPGFEVLECKGSWARGQESQSQEVIVQFGQESITIRSGDETVLTHWSLYFIQEIDESHNGVTFSPDPDSGEWLMIRDPLMIGALRGETIIKKPVETPRFSLGVSWSMIALILMIATAGAYFGADRLLEVSANLVAANNRSIIGENIYLSIHGTETRQCESDGGTRALDKLQGLLAPDERLDIRLLDGIPFLSRSLPGSIVILNSELLDRHDGPEVVAGFILLESERLRVKDPLLPFLEFTGPMRLFDIALGRPIADEHYLSYSRQLLASPLVPVDYGTLLERFEQADFPSRHFTNVIAFLDGADEGISAAGSYELTPYTPLLMDDEWQILRAICHE